MKKKRFSTEQIAAVLQQGEQGVPVGELCRQVGISEQSFYRWKKVYGGLQASEVRELKQLRDEVTKLKRLVADLSLDKVMLRDIVQKHPNAHETACRDALSHGPLCRQHTSGLSDGPDHALVGVLSQSERPIDRAAAADARAGPDAGPLQASPAAVLLLREG